MSTSSSSNDLRFRLGTGLVALSLVLLVAAIGFELLRQSQLSIAKFGLSFWINDVWDPVSGEFGARPFIWGTLYSSVLALALATPIALGIAIFLSELCPNVSPPAAHVPHRAAGGDPVDRLRALGHLRARAGGSSVRSVVAGRVAGAAVLLGTACWRRHALRRADSRGHGHSLHLVGRSRSA